MKTVIIFLAMFLGGCASTYNELYTKDMDEFYNQKETWELYDMDTGKRVFMHNIVEIELNKRKERAKQERLKNEQNSRN